jgi:hypothetical protein
MLFVGLLMAVLVAVPLQAVFGQAGADTQGGIFGEYEVQPAGRVEVPVEIRNVEGLYAIDIQIAFDPEIVQVEDADSNQAGVQPALGTFLDAGLTLFDEVDNETGLIRFVMTQANPSEAKSGSGVVLVLYLTGVREGESDLAVTILELSTRAGDAIAVAPVDGRIVVSADAVESEAASIPVQDSDLLVPIPTIIPTVAPTPSADESRQAEGDPAENAAGDQSGAEADAQSAEASDRSGASGGGFSLVEHWWIVLIVVVLVIGFGIYLAVTRK